MTPMIHPSDAERLNVTPPPAWLCGADIVVFFFEIIITEKFLTRFNLIILLLLHKYTFTNYLKNILYIIRTI